jgi:hypothetical protein
VRVRVRVRVRVCGMQCALYQGQEGLLQHLPSSHWCALAQQKTGPSQVHEKQPWSDARASRVMSSMQPQQAQHSSSSPPSLPPIGGADGTTATGGGASASASNPGEGLTGSGGRLTTPIWAPPA